MYGNSHTVFGFLSRSPSSSSGANLENFQCRVSRLRGIAISAQMVLHGSRWTARRTGKSMSVGLQKRDEFGQRCLTVPFKLKRKLRKDWKWPFQSGRLGWRRPAIDGGVLVLLLRSVHRARWFQIPYVGGCWLLDGMNEQIATPIWPGSAAQRVGVMFFRIMQEVVGFIGGA